MNRVDGKVAVVTGGTQGLGKAIAMNLAKMGAKGIVTLGRNEKRGEEVAKSVNQETSCETYFFKTELSDVNNCRKAIAFTLEKFTQIDILVNAAGLTDRGNIVETSEELFDKLFAINVKSVFLGAKAIIPLFKKQGKGGVILNTVSTAALRPRPGLTVYNSTKGALIPMTKALALEVSELNIRVNGICPVAGETPMLKDFLGSTNPEENHKKFISTVPLGRLAEPRDVANAALYLCSDEADFITGVMLEIDGGRTI